MEAVNNNLFEVKPTNNKRKILVPCPNVFLNPALDILANDDPICNTTMEVVPNKKKKHTNNCDIVAFENSALDLGISKAAVNEFLVRELSNVYKNVKVDNAAENQNKNTQHTIADNTTLGNKNKENNELQNDFQGQVYANVQKTTKGQTNTADQGVERFTATEITDAIIVHKVHDVSESNIEVLKQKPVTCDLDISNITNIEADLSNQILINNTSSMSLSFIDRLALDSPNISNQSLYLDDDLNESNIMEIKTITIITKKRRIPKKNTNPFLDQNSKLNPGLPLNVGRNPFLDDSNDLAYCENDLKRSAVAPTLVRDGVIPRKLFTYDTNSTISTVNESSMNAESQNDYENVDNYRSESPIYENIEDPDEIIYNKQSKVLGCDVSQFSAVDIMNLNKANNQSNSSNDSTFTKKDFKHHLLKVGNKLSKQVFKTFKKTFKTDKRDNDISLTPYEVPRKPKKQRPVAKESGIENPALNLNNSDDIEIEEIYDDENEYETMKTIRNTRLNMNVTPLKEKSNENEECSMNRTNTPGKKVRFDATLNREKLITGDSFESDALSRSPGQSPGFRQSPGFSQQIQMYHDELENCINERKYLQQNM